MTKTEIRNNKYYNEDILENTKIFLLRSTVLDISVWRGSEIIWFERSEVLRGRMRWRWWVLGTGDANTGKDENVCSSPRGGCQLSLLSGTSSGELRNSD